MACLVYLSKDLEIKRKFSHVLKTVNPRERILRPNLSAWDGAPAGERVGQPNLGNLGFQEGPKGVGGGGSRKPGLWCSYPPTCQRFPGQVLASAYATLLLPASVLWITSSLNPHVASASPQPPRRAPAQLTKQHPPPSRSVSKSTQAPLASWTCTVPLHSSPHSCGVPGSWFAVRTASPPCPRQHRHPLWASGPVSCLAPPCTAPQLFFSKGWHEGVPQIGTSLKITGIYSLHLQEGQGSTIRTSWFLGLGEGGACSLWRLQEASLPAPPASRDGWSSFVFLALHTQLSSLGLCRHAAFFLVSHFLHMILSCVSVSTFLSPKKGTSHWVRATPLQCDLVFQSAKTLFQIRSQSLGWGPEYLKNKIHHVLSHILLFLSLRCSKTFFPVEEILTALAGCSYSSPG